MVETCNVTNFHGRDKLSQKWSFKSEPPWKEIGTNGRLSDLIPC